MKFNIGTFAFLLGMVLLTLAPYPGVVYGQERVHVVQSGETFFSIGRTYGLTADELMRFNGITNPSRLQIGQRLRIPTPAGQSGSTTPSVSAGGFFFYHVVRGDTFFGLARRFSVSERAIREANRLSDSYILREGDTLRIPTEARIQQEARILGEVRAPTEVRVPVETRPPTRAATVNPAVTWPVTVQAISYMTGRLSGVMITGAISEPVRSLTYGTVISTGPYRQFGRVAIVQVDGGYIYVYGGCESLSVKEGDRVSPGTEIGRLGIDIVSNMPQLFFMVFRSNSPIDPAIAPRA